MTTEFSYWGYATKCGLTQDLLLAILHKLPAGNSHYELETFPTYGILIELLEFATNLGSTIHGLSTSAILKIWIDTLYPAWAITRPDRLERSIRRIALPIERKREQENLHGYLDRKWKPKIHQSKDFYTPLLSSTTHIVYPRKHLSYIKTCMAECFLAYALAVEKWNIGFTTACYCMTARIVLISEGFTV